MSPFKFKFTANPQCDSEGFPSEIADMQVSSVWLQMHNQLHRQAGERYESPLRDVYGIAAEMVLPMTERAIAFRKKMMPYVEASLANARANLAEPQPVKLSEMTDEELNEVHSHWLRNGRSE